MKNLISSIALLALVTSMIFSIPVSSYADSQSDTLIKIASQARDQVKIQLSKVDATSDVKEKFDLGSEQIELLIEAVRSENDAAAREHFLSAMTIFKEIAQQISERTATSAAALSDSASSIDTSRISHEIDRLERYIAQLKRIAINNGFDLDSSNADNLIEQARNDLRAGDSESAISAIDEIRQAITELNQILKEKTRQYTTDRAKTLAEKHLEDLERLIEQAKEMGVSEDTIEKLMEAKRNLNSISDASVEQIISEVKRIISVKHDFEKSKGDRIEARYLDIKEKIERLSSDSAGNPELDKAKSMISELRDLVSQGNFNEAIRLLNSINNLVNEIQNSVNEEIETDEASEERKTSLSDSKTDRIKVKIQRLESQMSQLEEKVGDNAASKRWLNNAISMLEDVKNQVDESPDNSLKVIMKIEQIIKRIQNTIQ